VLAGWDYDSSLTVASVDILRMSGAGNMLHERHYPNGGATALQVTSDGRLLLGGGFDRPWPDDGVYYFLMRADSCGDSLWTERFPSDYMISTSAVLQTRNGGFFLAGNASPYVDPTTEYPFALLTDAESDGVAGYSLRPRELGLSQNYPNPFNPTTEITFGLPRTTVATLKIFDVLGRDVATLKEGTMQAGEHRVTFDARNLPSGVYFCRLQSGSDTRTRKMLLIK